MAQLALSRAQVYRKVKEGTLKATKTDATLQFLAGDVQAAAIEQTSQRETVAQWLRVFADRLAKSGVTDLSSPEEPDDDAALVELGRRIVLNGIVAQASDIYVQPTASDDRLLIRSDGRIHEVGRLDSALGRLLKAKLKALAPLPQANTDRANESIFLHAHGKRSYQVRLGVVPTLAGEQLQLQFCHWSEEPTLESIGYSQQQVAALRDLLAGRPGLVVLTGTQDLVADEQRLALARSLGTRGCLIVAVDRRLHYRSERIMQLAGASDDGPSFTDHWQTALRLRPDAIILDTLQDTTEARALFAAIAAGITVIVQVPTATNVEALEYLVQLELSRSDLSRHLLVVSERRSLPRICPVCRTPRPCTDEEALLLRVSAATRIFEAAGCDHCDGGYRGLRTVYGLLVGDDACATAIRSAEPLATALEDSRLSPTLSLASALRAAALAGEVAFEHVQSSLRESIEWPPMPTAGDPAAADRGQKGA